MTIAAQRLDKWLWFARVVKTRPLAKALVEAGKVRVNRDRVTSADRLVRLGDVLTVVVGSRVRVLEVIGFAERRGDAKSVAGLALDRSPAPPSGDDADGGDEGE
ncbi:S4 domain-containing protein [Pseudoxanthobacter sp. M-2]|uniref:RNA-binding S4 domain-containing protein n=1 Tax=Pseudoxanthobacter sp. M-2 TaxID=3078754 RepID=UPI0038FC1035